MNREGSGAVFSQRVIRHYPVSMCSDDRLIRLFIASNSLHNENHGGCLLCGAGSAGDGYRVGSGWRASYRAAAYFRNAS
jgi:hypothetical protein